MKFFYLLQILAINMFNVESFKQSKRAIFITFLWIQMLNTHIFSFTLILKNYEELDFASLINLITDKHHLCVVHIVNKFNTLVPCISIACPIQDIGNYIKAHG